MTRLFRSLDGFVASLGRPGPRQLAALTVIVACLGVSAALLTLHHAGIVTVPGLPAPRTQEHQPSASSSPPTAPVLTTPNTWTNPFPRPPRSSTTPTTPSRSSAARPATPASPTTPRPATPTSSSGSAPTGSSTSTATSAAPSTTAAPTPTTPPAPTTTSLAPDPPADNGPTPTTG